MEKKKILPVIIFFFAISSTGVSQYRSDRLAKADSLYKNFHESEALEQYSSVLKEDPDHYLALWRSSFLYSRIGFRLDEEEQQRQHYNRAIKLAERALHLDSTDTQSNFVMAVAMGRKAMISGAKGRVQASRAIKKYAERALKADSMHAGALHVLGRWHYKVANLNFLERAAANTLFDGVPAAREEKALRYLQKAVNLKPSYILYRYDLARVYKHVGKEQLAVDTCIKALDLKLLAPDDDAIQQNCRKLIETIQ
ncbi:MAG: hypothetical protein U5K69_19755 [Balneolaceae bacterium]|nr:hypothetical protein [Balneolaceae bacterium]